MLKIDKEFITALTSDPEGPQIEGLLLLVTPPREWHKEKMTKFLETLKTQLPTT